MPKKCTHPSCKFDTYENEKCIFHCEKNIENGWVTQSTEKYDKVNEKIEEFWNEFIDEFSSMTLKSDIVIPFYHTNLVDTNDLPDIRTLKTLDFKKCTFVDDFHLKERDDEHVLKKLLLLDCIVLKRFDVYDLKLEYLSLLHVTFQENPVFQNISLSNGAEIMDLKAFDNKDILINFNNIKSSNNQFEIWRIGDKNVSLRISSCYFEHLYIHELDCKKIEFNEVTKFNKLKMEKSKIQNIFFNNIDFLENSRILFEVIDCNRLILNKVSQESKYIQFNHIKVDEEFVLRKVEFHNTYFNDFDISNATKTIAKTSFVDSKLSSLKWGNISKITASRDFFRELKSVYDENHNYIEANNFFTMEMKEYKKELKEKGLNFWQENFVFFLNEKISNFSQSWFLPLVWIFIINFLFFSLQQISSSESTVLQLSIFLIISIVSWILGRLVYEIKQSGSYYLAQHIFFLLGLVIYVLYSASMVDVLQFSHIQSYKDYKESSEISVFYLWFLHKLILSFIIYHLVVALRRQTRR